MGHWVGQSPGTSEQQLQKQEAAEDRGGEGSFDACAGRRGLGGERVYGCCIFAYDAPENEFSHCCVLRSQGFTSRLADIGTAFQLHLVPFSAVYKVSNDVNTSFSLETLPGFLLAGCCCVGAIASRALGVGDSLCSVVGVVACLSLAALACKMEALVIKHVHCEGHLGAVLGAIICRAGSVLVQIGGPS